MGRKMNRRGEEGRGMMSMNDTCVIAGYQCVKLSFVKSQNTWFPQVSQFLTYAFCSNYMFSKFGCLLVKSLLLVKC